MYAGRKVEEATVAELFARPLHPYTRGLLGSMPHLGKSAAGGGRTRLVEIPGVVPSLKEAIPGCLFAPRCTYAAERCHREVPPLVTHGPGHLAACWESERLPAHEPGGAPLRDRGGASA
jgi:peptide/nickel transport system ATP-binding protein